VKEVIGINGCSLCALKNERKNIVVGKGDIDADVMVIGEAPGREEDLQEKPFVGKAGKLLDKILDEADIDKNRLYITNIVKCRPPSNRNPRKKEKDKCESYLIKQIKQVGPKVIVALGKVSSSRLVGEDIKVSKLHGSIKTSAERFGDIDVFISYHPAAALYNPNLEKILIDDFKKLRFFLDFRE